MLQAKEPKMALEDLASVLRDEPNNFVAICTEAHCMFLVGNFEKSLMVWHKGLNRKDKTSALLDSLVFIWHLILQGYFELI